MMRVILVDDEQYALKVLENMLLNVDNVEIVASYTDPKKALDEIQTTSPQGALLDIEMPGINGLELGAQLTNLKPDIEIIYVTAYSEYALDAFEVSAIDYLLKPVNEKRLKAAIQRLETRISKNHLSFTNKNDETLKIKSFGGFEIHDSDDNVISWRTKKAKELFIYLWLKESGSANRDHIIEDIFPDKTADRASALLHTTIYQIRNSLRLAGFRNSIQFSNESYRLIVPTNSDAEDLNTILKKKEKKKRI